MKADELIRLTGNVDALATRTAEDLTSMIVDCMTELDALIPKIVAAMDEPSVRALLVKRDRITDSMRTAERLLKRL